MVLSAPATAYSHDSRKSMLEPPQLMVGAAASLVTAVQVGPGGRSGPGAVAFRGSGSGDGGGGRGG